MLIFLNSQVLVLENDAQLKKILKLPLDKLGLLAVVQYSGTMNKPSELTNKSGMPKFLEV